MDNTNAHNKPDQLEQVDFEILVFNEYGTNNPHENQIVSKHADFEKAWQQKFANQYPTPQLPKVDFNKHLVLFLDFGERTHGGNKIKIDSIQLKNKNLLVYIKENKSDPDQVYTSVMTRPFMFLRIDKFEVQNVLVK